MLNQIPIECRVPVDCKECVNDCKISHNPLMSIIAQKPIFDKKGSAINLEDPIISGFCTCLTCDQDWAYTLENGKVHWKRIYEN